MEFGRRVRVLNAPFTREKVFETTQNSKCTRSVRGNRNSKSERESGCTYVCGVSGVQNTRRRNFWNTGKGNFCTCNRFSADGFRTRATRVIRWRVLGVRATKGETERRRAGRPGDSRTLGKTVCVCRCALCVQSAGTQGPFHAPPQLQPMVRGEEQKEKA